MASSGWTCGAAPAGPGRCRRFAAEAVFGEAGGDQAGDVGFVLDDEDEGAVLVGAVMVPGLRIGRVGEGGEGGGEAAPSKGLRRVGMSGVCPAGSPVA